MLAVVVEFRIRAAHVDAFDAAIRANARDSLAHERGCRRFDVCRDPADPALFFLYELYDDDAAFDAHLRSPHFLRLDAQAAPWVEAKAVRRLRLAPPL